MGIDGLGLVMATALLTVKFFRRGNDVVAAGFLFAIGESVMLSGTATGLVGSIPSFAAGTALWTTSLLLISVPKEFPRLGSICRHGLKNFLGRTAVANLVTVLRVPLHRHWFHRLDLDLVERGLTRIGSENVTWRYRRIISLSATLETVVPARRACRGRT